MPPVPSLTGRDTDPKTTGRAIEDWLRHVMDALAAWDPDASPVIVSETAVDGALSLGDTSTIAATSGTGTVTLDVVDGSITSAKFRDSVGFSVVGKPTTGSGDTSDIVSGTDAVLGRNGAGNLAFAQVVTGQIAASAVVYSKIQNVSATSRLLGRVTSGSGVVEEVTPVQAVAMLTISNRPAQFTANQDNLALSFGVNFVSSDASRDVTGIVASTVDGQRLEIINNGSNAVVLKHLNGGSTSGNQIITPGGADLTLAATQASVLWYDLTATKWRAYAL